MKNSKFLLLPAMIALISLTGCKKNEVQTGHDDLGFIPESVTSYQGDIDVLLYIEGQSGEMRDIGNPKELKATFLMRLWHVLVLRQESLEISLLE